MDVRQFRYSSDNLGYLLYGKDTAMAVDGGAVEEILHFTKIHDLRLVYVTNTHGHMDHTVGNRGLLAGSDAAFLDMETLIKKRAVHLEGEEIHIYHTPGHTKDSITFYFENILLTGDTLFIGKVGRCFSGDVEGFLQSVRFLMEFPPDTTIYPGHDYVEEYMDFVRDLEPDNPHIDEFLNRYDPGHVRSTLGEERTIDPFLRFNDEKIISILDKKGLPTGTEPERWTSLLSLM
jgi:hydroxyacylglutathione hydrolase